MELALTERFLINEVSSFSPYMVLHRKDNGLRALRPPGEDGPK